MVIQGFGDVGAVAARAFHREGAKIVAVSDSYGGIHDENGLDPDAVAKFKAEQRTVVGMAGTRTVTNAELLELDCDILLPAALGNQIRGDNAHCIKARLIVEGANNPTTPLADEILQKRGIHVLPDILVNAGGVTVSYYEWVQNQANEQWDIEVVNARLKAQMYKAVDTVFERWQAFVVGEAHTPVQSGPAEPARPLPDFRTVALIIAIERVVRATLMRGIWP